MTSIKVSAEQVNISGNSFGYYWWMNESRGIVFMWGKGGQFVIIKPSKNLVVVTTADPNDGNTNLWLCNHDRPVEHRVQTLCAFQRFAGRVKVHLLFIFVLCLSMELHMEIKKRTMVLFF